MTCSASVRLLATACDRTLRKVLCFWDISVYTCHGGKAVHSTCHERGGYSIIDISCRERVVGVIPDNIIGILRIRSVDVSIYCDELLAPRHAPNFYTCRHGFRKSILIISPCSLTIELLCWAFLIVPRTRCITAATHPLPLTRNVSSTDDAN